MPLFDRYLIVDWSASRVPKTGKDSIWLSLCDCDGFVHLSEMEANPPTRSEAERIIRDICLRSLDKGRRLFVGFDFGLGYPRGAADKLTGKDNASWRDVWRVFGELFPTLGVTEDRFAKANDLNRNWPVGEGPYWRHPGGEPGTEDKKKNIRVKPEKYRYLPFKKPNIAQLVPERRYCEAAMPRAKSNWELLNPGSVGSQTMLGMAMLDRLLSNDIISKAVSVWPFETDFNQNLDSQKIVFAEIYPSAFTIDLSYSELGVPDEAQVKTLAAGFAALDGRETGYGKSAFEELLAAPKSLRGSEAEEKLKLVLKEEGWIVGVGDQFNLLIDAIAQKNRCNRTEEQCKHRGLAVMTAYEYIRHPSEIYQLSFAAIEREADFSGFDADKPALATRLIHACGMVNIIDDLEMSLDAVEKGRAALQAGATIFCDVEMVRHGIVARKLSAQNEIVCTLTDDRVAEHAKAIGNTRSAAAVDFWDEQLEGSIVVIGNAPTALFRLLERLEDGAPKPALVIGIPVGFIGAAESKQALAEKASQIPFITVHGRRGGSALAAAALNAVAAGLST